jgi:hypothetical protein
VTDDFVVGHGRGVRFGIRNVHFFRSL